MALLFVTNRKKHTYHNMMLLVSGANTVKLSLLEKTTLTSPSYYIVFENCSTRERYMCVTDSYTTVEDFWTQFTLTVTANPTWTNCEVSLGKKGEYRYYVYEQDPLNPINYNTVVAADPLTYVPTYFVTLVESGIMDYPAADATINNYKTYNTPVKAYGD